MLGAIKGDAQSQMSLFRLLSRRWRPLAAVKPSPPSFLPLAEDAAPPRAPAWIGAKRRRYAAGLATDAAKTTASSWNPWMWVK